ncbi:hypothetical protein DSO57_1006404 [Entomophthora muscae]|uniref:Uncharacterized protein n=1 Tax=Entomophthora muscae TaxID=34485 RepID=A0ACC2TII6_9FUNG|nr:hypothetical protein DSO57_1006404 [Entomophthora muscae]
MVLKVLQVYDADVQVEGDKLTNLASKHNIHDLLEIVWRTLQAKGYSGILKLTPLDNKHCFRLILLAYQDFVEATEEINIVEPFGSSKGGQDVQNSR